MDIHPVIFDLYKQGHIMGDMGWFGARAMKEAFEKEILKHHKGNVFKVSLMLGETDMTYLVYKIESEKYFKRYTLVTIHGVK